MPAIGFARKSAGRFLNMIKAQRIPREIRDHQTAAFHQPRFGLRTGSKVRRGGGEIYHGLSLLLRAESIAKLRKLNSPYDLRKAVRSLPGAAQNSPRTTFSRRARGPVAPPGGASHVRLTGTRLEKLPKFAQCPAGVSGTCMRSACPFKISRSDRSGAFSATERPDWAAPPKCPMTKSRVCSRPRRGRWPLQILNPQFEILRF